MLKLGKELNPSQRKAINLLAERKYPRVLWTGAIRSGKGCGAAAALMHLVSLRTSEGDRSQSYIVAGATAGSFVRNNESYLLDAANAFGFDMKPVGGLKPGYQVLLAGLPVARFYLFGGDNKRSYLPVRGVTAQTAWIDESTLCHQSFVTTCEERLSAADSCMLLTHNADTPNHWLKREWMDPPPLTSPHRAMWEKTRFIESAFDENRHYPQERRQELLNQNPNTGNYRRAIGNLWASAEGLVFDIPDKAIVDYMCGRIGEVFVDPGVGSVCAALLAVRQKDGTICVASEYYHDREKLGALTDAEHLSSIIRKWEAIRLVVDPSGANMRSVSRKQGIPTRYGKNDFDQGVKAVNDALWRGDLTIHKDCINLLTEASGYQWSDTSERPVYGPDHALDCLRYLAMHYWPPKSAILAHGG